MLCDVQEATIELFNDYSLIDSEKDGKGRPCMLAHVDKVSDRSRPSNLFSRLKILTSKQMLQNLQYFCTIKYR